MNLNQLRSRGMAGFNASSAGQSCARFSIFKKISEGERQVVLIGFQAVVNGGENTFFRDFRAETCRQRTQRSQPPLAYNAFRFFGYYTKKTVDLAVVAGERAV